MFIEIIKELIVLFFILFGLINLVRLIIDKIYKEEIVNKSKGLFASFFLGYIALYASGLFNYFSEISNLNEFISEILQILVWFSAFSFAYSLWMGLDYITEKKILKKILFESNDSLFDMEGREDDFYYYKLSSSYDRRFTGNRHTKKLLEDFIENHYDLYLLKNHYIFIDNKVNFIMFETDEKLKDYFRENILKDDILIKFEDGQITSIEKNFIDKLFNKNKYKISKEN